MAHPDPLRLWCPTCSAGPGFPCRVLEGAVTVGAVHVARAERAARHDAGMRELASGWGIDVLRDRVLPFVDLLRAQGWEVDLMVRSDPVTLTVTVRPPSSSRPGR